VQESVTILGVRIDRVDMAQSMARIDQFIVEGGQHRVVTVNLDYLRHSLRIPAFLDALTSADLAVADGAPVVWACRLFGRPVPERVAGVDLADRCAELAAARGYGLFLLGAGPGVAEAAAVVLRTKYPDLRVVGTITPPLGEFSQEEEQHIGECIRKARPHILLVALPTPRQELWNHRHVQEWEVPVTVGVGAAFDMLSGRVPRAPHWMQRSGLEWLFRLWLEPRRLWRRYLIHDAPVLVRVLLSRLGLRRTSTGYRAASGPYQGNT
jgi:N-acetylglucosaminyldiphosphoundecaprenol N-acetyl-beta-D-mannosaminyltransferase